MKKLPPIWSSSSKWFIPFHLCIMALTFLLALFLTIEEVEGSQQPEGRLCLAQNIYFEAANQPLAGRIAVSNVVMNRVEDGQFPNSICGVIYEAKWEENWKGNMIPIRNQCQFSWFCDGKSDDPTDSKTWMQAIRLADRMLDGTYEDITEGALWYHADHVDPYWNDYLEETVTINNHIFYK